jgi:hypothetical protein
VKSWKSCICEIFKSKSLSTVFHYITCESIVHR